MESRDKAKFRNICIKKISIKTVMGTIEYSRRIYRYYDEDGNKHYISHQAVWNVVQKMGEKIQE